MTPTDLQAQLQLLLKVSAPPLIEVAPLEAPAGTAQWTQGQRLPGEVLANLPNGRFQVQVGDAVLDMNLPASTRLGEKLNLTLLTLQPRLTFALSRDVAQPSQVNLSASARFLGALLGKAAQTPPTPLTQATPLLAAPPSDGTALTQALRQAVAQSGLFYEAHQAQWVNGQKSLPELMQEPQAKLPPPLPRSSLPLPAQAAAAATPPSSAPSPLPGGEILPTGTPFAGAPPHPQSLPLVQQQLHVLDSQQIVWQGQVWPGQQMEWRIEEHAAPPEAAQQATWYSRLDLQLPRLGKVTALLSLYGGELRVNLKAAEPHTLAELDAAQTALRMALQAAGIAATTTAVAADEHA